MTDAFTAALAAYITKLESFASPYGFQTVTTMIGVKNLKIVCNGNGSRNVHAFVNLDTGDVLKPAGWSGPAKGARYNLLDSASLASLVTRIDGYGSYLYK